MRNKPFAKPIKQAFFSLTTLFFISILCVILAILSPGIALAAEITLHWNLNDQATGYKLYYGFESRSYDFIIDVGTTTEHTISDFNHNQPHYFALTAYNDHGESDFSKELVYDPDLDLVYQPPTADAGPDQIANEFAAVTLNGSNSNDPDDGIASFYWEQIDGPFVDLADQRDEVISFTAPEGTAEGTSLTFNLTVSDYSGLQSQDSCTVTVKPVSNETADTVKITKALYKTAYEKLTVKATSDAPAKSVVLTVWADFDGTEVELGNLRYDGIKKLYIKVFKRLNLIPDSITVESSGGGIDTQPAVIK